MHTATLITEDDFEAIYRPVAFGPHADHVHPHLDAEVRTAAGHNVWTIVDGDDGNLWALPGLHVVNRVGYVITEKPWATGDEEAQWCVFEAEIDEVDA